MFIFVNHQTLEQTGNRWVNNFAGPCWHCTLSLLVSSLSSLNWWRRFWVFFRRKALTWEKPSSWKFESMGLFKHVSLESAPRCRLCCRKDTLAPHPLLSFWQSVNKDSTISSCQWCHLGLCPRSLYLQARSNHGAAARGASLRKLAPNLLQDFAAALDVQENWACSLGAAF